MPLGYVIFSGDKSCFISLQHLYCKKTDNLHSDCRRNIHENEDNHSIGRSNVPSNVPSAGDIRFLSFPKWTAMSPLRSSDCGASFLGARFALEIQMQSCPFKIDRGKKILTQPDAPLPGGVANAVKHKVLQSRNKQKGISSLAPPPLLVVCLFISPNYTSIWNLLPLLLGRGWVDECHTSRSTS